MGILNSQTVKESVKLLRRLLILIPGACSLGTYAQGFSFWIWLGKVVV